MAILTLTPCTYLTAQQADKHQPIVVTADRSEYSEKSQQQTLTGNVSIVQGSLKIHADKIIIHLQGGVPERVDARGKPATFEQLDDTGQQVTGAANRIKYQESSGQAVFIGNARLTNAQQTLSGDSIHYNTITQAAVAKMNEGGSQQVNIVIKPTTPQ